MTEHMPRRAFLAGTGALAASALTASAGAPIFGPLAAAAHEEDCSCLTAWHDAWSVARVEDRYVALAGKIDKRSLKIYDVLVAPDRTVKLGSYRPVEFPDGFAPSVLHGNGKRLLAGGAKIVEAERFSVDYSVSPSHLSSPYLLGYKPPHADGIHEISITTHRPALFEIDKSGVRELAIGDVAGQVGWGAITDIVNMPGNGMAMRIAGSTSHQVAYGDRVIVAETRDGGATWFGDTVVTGLGKGSHGGLAVSDSALVTITVDQFKRRNIWQRTAGMQAPWSAVEAGSGGHVLGAVSSRGGSVVVLSSASDRVVRQRYETTTRRWVPESTDAVAGATTHAVMTIGGAPGEWLAIGQESARLITETA